MVPSTIKFSVDAIHDQSFLMGIPTQSFTTLAFTSNHDQHWALERDTLNFPVLQTLVLETVDAHDFMNAILAPKVEHLDYTRLRGFCLWIDLDDSEAHTLCQAFSGVCHATLHSEDLEPLATNPSRYLGNPGKIAVSL